MSGWRSRNPAIALGKTPLDLVQVHNLADLPTQMPVIEEHKQDGKIRYIGTTSTRARTKKCTLAPSSPR